jgi:Tripartite tricarboxylate transporter family receptor
VACRSTLTATRHEGAGHPLREVPRYGFTAFLKRRGLDMPFVPYRDIATPQVDLGEGRMQILVTSVLATSAPVQSGKARIIAVLDAQRAPMLPDVPTAAEAGYPEMTVDAFAGLFGWRDMPSALRDRIAGDVQAVAKNPLPPRRRGAARDRHHTGGVRCGNRKTARSNRRDRSPDRSQSRKQQVNTGRALALLLRGAPNP